MRLSAALLALGALAACRTSSSARLTLPSGEPLTGGATVAVNGQYAVARPGLNCTGTYEGRHVVGLGLTYQRKAPVTVRCSDGRTGTSADQLWEGREAVLNLSDGSKARLTIAE